MQQEANDALSQPLTLDEIQYSVKKGKKNKSPGINGIGYEFYKAMWDIIKEDILEIFNEMYVQELKQDSEARRNNMHTQESQHDHL
jgi:hypothetical protein